MVLLEANQRKSVFLEEAIRRCDLEGRVEVLSVRAESAAASPPWRASFDLVVARGFGAPAVTAECAAPFLRAAGVAVVSEPPFDERAQVRWPDQGLEQLGMRLREIVRGDFGFAVLEQQRPCPSGFPRRLGVPAKRPLF